MRLSEKRTQYLREEMPYGAWTMSDGNLVLFNRSYQPIWYIRSGETPIPMNREDRMTWELQIYFYRDDNSPWKNRHTLKICLDFLECVGISTLAGDWKV